MSGKNTAVFGIYPNESEIVEAIEHLTRLGFRPADLSIMLPENLGSKDIGHEKHTKAPEGSVVGGFAGAVVGAALGWLASVGSIQIPLEGASSLMTVSPVIAIFAGIGVLGMAGALIGAIVGATSPEYEAKRYQGRIRSSRILLSVHCDNAQWRVRAKNVLRHTGAEGIASTGEAKADFALSEKPRPRAQTKLPFARKTLLTNTDGARIMQPHSSDPTVEEARSRSNVPIQ